MGGMGGLMSFRTLRQPEIRLKDDDSNWRSKVIHVSRGQDVKTL